MPFGIRTEKQVIGFVSGGILRPIYREIPAYGVYSGSQDHGSYALIIIIFTFDSEVVD